MRRRTRLASGCWWPRRAPAPTHARRPRVPRARTAYLYERAMHGPWIEAWQDLPGHPYNELFLRLGVRAIAYAPVRDGSRAIGFLAIGSAVRRAEEQLSSVMPA